jgi:opacity protein-like surface antigen
MFSRKLPRPTSFIIIIAILVLALTTTSPPALANSTSETFLIMPWPALVALGTAGYLVYKNRLSQPADAKSRLGYKGPGEFFVGGFLGGAFITNTSLNYQAYGQNMTVNNIKIDPGVTGGIKLGYFLERLPYFGIEAESSLGSHFQQSQSVAFSRPPSPRVIVVPVHGRSILVWTMALHLMGRYGFFPDSKVPFGRFQPYVGIGPGLVALYAEANSAQSLSLEVEAGLRYMFTKNLGGFLEYKFQQLFDIGITDNAATFDFSRNRIVLGLAYHF